MSDDDRHSDIESDAGKRAHHNALERKRRDNLKESFIRLRDSLPAFQGDKVRASRSDISKKAAEYIMNMRKKNLAQQQDIDGLKRQNKVLEDQIRSLEQAKATGNFAAVAAVLEAARLTNNRIGPASGFDMDSDSDESSNNSGDSKDEPRKRLKPN